MPDFLKQIRPLVFKVTVLSLLTSCAQVVTPGGGARDTTPPKVLQYRPDSAQLNFASKTIEIDFDEYIQLKDLNSQLIISPPLEKTPDFQLKNKRLTIDMSGQELKPNTTYSINFGNALQDNNENNPKENFSYIFSTGSFIDSLKVKGKVQYAFDHRSEKGLIVMLYSDTDDSVLFKKLPDYFARTDADGNFEIRNVKQGLYKVAALKDANSNYKYDGAPENIAFIDSLVDPSQKKFIHLDLFQEPAKKIFIKKYSNPSYGKIIVILNEGTDSIRVNNLTNDKKGVQEFLDFSRFHDTLTYWVKNYDKDSLRLQVSNGNVVIDTLEFKMIKLEDALKSKRNPLKLSLVSSPAGNQSFNLGSELSLRFNNLLTGFNLTNFTLKEDTTKMQQLCGYVHQQSVSMVYWDSTNRTEDPNNPDVTITSPVKAIYTSWKENTKYHLFIPPGAITDIFGLTNDTIKFDFKTREAKYYGSLKLSISVPELSEFKNQYYQGKTETETFITRKPKATYIVQLLDDKGNIVREDFITQSTTVNYNYLPPNKYRIKLIFDTNGDQKWSSGDYLKKVQPEKVLFDAEEITIRSNWDAEIDWKVTN